MRSQTHDFLPHNGVLRLDGGLDTGGTELTAPASQLGGLMTNFLSQVSESVTLLVARVAPLLAAIRVGQNRHVTGFLWRNDLVITTDQALPAGAAYSIVLSNGALTSARPGPRDSGHNLAALWLDNPVRANLPEGARSTAIGALVLALGADFDGSPTVRLTTIHGFPRMSAGGAARAAITLDLAGDRVSHGGMVLDADGRMLGMTTVSQSGDAMVVPHSVIARFAEAAIAAAGTARAAQDAAALAEPSSSPTRSHGLPPELVPVRHATAAPLVPRGVFNDRVQAPSAPIIGGGQDAEPPARTAAQPAPMQAVQAAHGPAGLIASVPVDAPIVVPAPVQAAPVEPLPVHTPIPVAAIPPPPIETPPIETPPVEAPPLQAAAVQAAVSMAPAIQTPPLQAPPLQPAHTPQGQKLAGHATPIPTVTPHVEPLNSGAHQSHPPAFNTLSGRRGWLGVSLQPITVPDNLVQRAGQTTARQVVSVTRGGPAERAGLRGGDVLLAVDRTPTTGNYALRNFLIPERIGHQVELRLMRDGLLHTAVLTIEAQPEN